MKIRVKVEGLKEIQAALHELPKSTARNVMRRVLKDVAEPIADQARQLAPVLSGDLKQSIGVSTKLSRRAKKDTGKLSANAVQVYIGPFAAPRAIIQEFGSFKEPPQPYMRPAWDANQGEILGKIGEMMWNEIAAAAARKARKEARAAAKAAAGGGGSEGE
jgi:HK97 gp10 family phage protein